MLKKATRSSILPQGWYKLTRQHKSKTGLQPPSPPLTATDFSIFHPKGRILPFLTPSKRVSGKTLAHWVTVSCSFRERRNTVETKHLFNALPFECLTSLLSFSAHFIMWLLPWDQVAQHWWYSNTQTLLNCLLLQSAGGHVYYLNLLHLFTVLILIK